ncbi:MAG: hypothetical protein IJQ14_09610 [Bacteroidales bacterium]|nr:hypothetical protein [Bacteroidales bacterium]
MNVLYYSVVVVVLFVGYQYVAIISKKALGTHIEPTKVAEGKNRMSVLNAVRAKLILTMFAVIRDNRPFDPNFNYFEEKIKINLAKS